MCEHKFKPLKIEKDGKKVQACQECGALKIGEDTIVVDEDYIELSPLTADPALAEGRMWFRSDTDKAKWSPDGAIVEEFSTAGIGGPDLTSIMGFVYLASGAATDSWNFTADLSESAWIRQYSTDACFQSKYNFYGTYAHWTADNTFVDTPSRGKADNVYGDGEVLSVSQVPDGTQVKSFPIPSGKPQGGTWDGQYLYFSDEASGGIYKYRRDGTKVGFLNLLPDGYGTTDATWDGAYIWGTCPELPDFKFIYQWKPDGTYVQHWEPTEVGNPQGITWDGEYLWIGDLNNNGIYKYTPNGVMKDFFPTFDYQECLGFDGTYIWSFNNVGGCGSSPGLGKAYRFKEDGTQIDYFETPGDCGEAVFWDGKYLWYDDELMKQVYCFTGSKTFDLNYEVSPV